MDARLARRWVWLSLIAVLVASLSGCRRRGGPSDDGPYGWYESDDWWLGGGDDGDDGDGGDEGDDDEGDDDDWDDEAEDWDDDWDDEGSDDWGDEGSD